MRAVGPLRVAGRASPRRPQLRDDVLTIAALLDQPFSVSAIAAVIALPESAVALAVRASTASGVLRDSEDGLEFAAESERIRRTARLGPSVRRALHREIGRAMARAGQPVGTVARQMAAGAEEGDSEVLGWLRRGAVASLGRDPEEAVRLLDTARRIAVEDDDVASVAAELAEALRLAGRIEEALEIALGALDVSHSAAADEALFTALARAQRNHSRPAEAAATVGRLLASSPPGPGRGRLLAVAADALVMSGAIDAGEVAARAAAELAEIAGDEPGRSQATAALARARLWRGDLDAAVALSGNAARSALRTADEESRREAVYLLAMHLMHVDRFADAARIFEAERDRRRQGDAHDRLVERGLGFVAYHAGEWQIARRHLEASCSGPAGRSVHWDLVPALSILASMRARANALSEAGALIEAARDEIEGSGTTFSVEWVHWARALALEAAGDTPGAVAEAGLALSAIEAGGAVVRLRVLGPDLARLSYLAGATDLVARISQVLTSHARPADSRSMAAAVLLCRALAGDGPDELLGAVDAYRETPRAAELALALESVGTALARRGLHDARSLLVEGLSGYASIGAVRDAARVRATMRAYGWRIGSRETRRRPQLGWPSLTATEQRIAGLVAEGSSNRQIAGRLSVSPRTVESHVGHILAKLGLSSRAALAVAVERARIDSAG